jgi:hypothetical protein
MTPAQEEAAHDWKEVVATLDWSNHPLLKACEGAERVYFEWLEPDYRPIGEWPQWVAEYNANHPRYVILEFDSYEDYQQWLKEQNDEETGSSNEGQQEGKSVRQEG